MQNNYNRIQLCKQDKNKLNGAVFGKYINCGLATHQKLSMSPPWKKYTERLDRWSWGCNSALQTGLTVGQFRLWPVVQGELMWCLVTPPSYFSKGKHFRMTVTWVSCIYIELGKIGGLRPVWFNTWYFVNAGSFPQGDHHQPQGSHHCAANLVRRFLETVATDAACQLCGAAGVPTHRRGNLLESLGRKDGISDRFIQRVDSTNKPCGFPWCRGISWCNFSAGRPWCQYQSI